MGIGTSAPAPEGEPGLVEQGFHDARGADPERRGSAGRGRGEGAEPGEECFGLTPRGVAPYSDRDSAPTAGDPRQLGRGARRILRVLDGVERGDHVEARLLEGQRLEVTYVQVSVRDAVAGHV
ncbi:hypothetical protein LVO85_11130 [Ornithinimicrobium sp. EGI L100131]|nr:hypothetical protein [Ornithinimicrobium sediminis]MCE0487398.1 hypothetical protein [Ornithinimicrobium sediminis]